VTIAHRIRREDELEAVAIVMNGVPAARSDIAPSVQPRTGTDRVHAEPGTRLWIGPRDPVASLDLVAGEERLEMGTQRDLGG
jgi:hypothetical protein